MSNDPSNAGGSPPGEPDDRAWAAIGDLVDVVEDAMNAPLVTVDQEGRGAPILGDHHAAFGALVTAESQGWRAVGIAAPTARQNEGECNGRKQPHTGDLREKIRRARRSGSVIQRNRTAPKSAAMPSPKVSIA